MEELQKDFISKSLILKYLSQEQIFEMVFGYLPVVDEYVTSPFREDDNAGCWFSYDDSEVLRFTDYANSDNINGIDMMNIDCFNAVQVYFKLPNFFQTLNFIRDRIRNQNLTKIEPKNTKTNKEKVKISIKPRDYTKKDGRFWSDYGISKKNLLADKVYAVKVMRLLNTKGGDIVKRLEESCYAYTRFPEERKKLYFPYRSGKGKFITNCVQNDIGEILTLPTSGKILIITKSYKDCRVLKNLGYNSVWIQNEGMLPSNQILLTLSRRFKTIIVLFDNDPPGISAGKKITSQINLLHRFKAYHIHLPVDLLETRGISDPSDLYKKKGSIYVKQFLKNSI